MFGLSLLTTEKLNNLIEQNESKTKEILELQEKYNSLQIQNSLLQTLRASYKLKIACLEKQREQLIDVGKIEMKFSEDRSSTYYVSKWQEELNTLKQAYQSHKDLRTMKLIKESTQKIDKLRQYKKDKNIAILYSTPWLLHRHAKVIDAVEDDKRMVTINYQVTLSR